MTEIPGVPNAYFLYTPAGLAILAPKIAKTPYQISFESGKLEKRSLKMSYQKEFIVRACILKNLNRPTNIVDATAGFGRDGFILASSGAKVTLIERHPIIANLLEDGIARIQNTMLKKRFQLFKKDAKEILNDFSKQTKKPDVIYLDPMFHEARTSKVKKELQILQMLLAKEMPDQNELLPLALKAAHHRVVVKRAIHAHPLNNITPSFNLKGKHSRFDVYLL